MKTKDYIFIKRFNHDDGTFEHETITIFDQEEPELIFIKTYTPTAKDKIYIFPDSNVPRFKIKGFCDKYNVSLSKYKESANILIGSPEALTDDLWESENYDHFMYKSYFLNILKMATRVGDVRYVKLIQDITDNPEATVIIDNSARYRLSTNGINGYIFQFIEADSDDLSVIPTVLDRQKYYFQNTDEQRKLLAYLENTTIYHRDALLNILNEDLVIDQEMYEGLKNMFESSGKDDHKVAMEGMANSDYLKSALYLLFLFKDYRHQIYISDTKHHVNFKSLCKFFNHSAGNHLDLDDIMDKLVEKNVLDETSLKKMLELATEEILAQYDMRHFVIKLIEPTDEVKAIAAKNTPVAAPVNDPTAEFEKIFDTPLEYRTHIDDIL